MEWNEFSLANLEAATTSEIYQRGSEYFRQGQVAKACIVDNILAGTVTGTGGNYKVRLWFNRSELQGDCSCPYLGFCKHMVALGIAWLEERADFTDLQPQLTMTLESPSNQTQILLALIHKDPLNFLELFPEITIDRAFITSRGILNLIRNTFAAPQIRIADAETVWGNIQRIQKLIECKIQINDPQAFELFVELLSGMEMELESYHSKTLMELFAEVIHSLKSIISNQNISQESLLQLFIKLWALYLNPNFWELAPELQPILLVLNEYEPDFLYQQISAFLGDETSFLILILLYTLLAEAPAVNTRLQDCLGKVTAKLSNRLDGSLWLIDRFAECNPTQAYKMAKEGMHLFSEERASFRERLIMIHQRRSELKQAAALSFIQFQEEPNFEEYCRLKGLLIDYPQDWRNYLKRIKQLLKSQTAELLAVRIIIAECDCQGITDYLERILAEDILLIAAAQILTGEIQTNFMELYPLFIKALLQRQTLCPWKIASQLMIVFKSYCLYAERHKDEWEHLRTELEEIYRCDARFAKKFGKILS
jgi:hypothetical protein